jgi:hypothetical protein
MFLKQMHTNFKILITYFPHTTKEMDFDNKKSQIFQKMFLMQIIFWKGSFATNFLKYGTTINIWSFLCKLYFLFSQRTIHFFFNLKTIIIWSTFKWFLNAITPLVVLYMINHFHVQVFAFKFQTKLSRQKIQRTIWGTIKPTFLFMSL